jgi:hypothetical protein
MSAGGGRNVPMLSFMKRSLPNASLMLVVGDHVISKFLVTSSLQKRGEPYPSGPFEAISGSEKHGYNLLDTFSIKNLGTLLIFFTAKKTLLCGDSV